MSPERTVSKAAAVNLLRAEMSLLDPAFRHDRERVSALLAPDFVEFGASGRVWSREQILDLLATENYTPPVMEDFACRAISMDVVLVTYRTIYAGNSSGHREIVLRSSLWRKRANTWLLCFHQGTRAG